MIYSRPRVTLVTVTATDGTRISGKVLALRLAQAVSDDGPL